MTGLQNKTILMSGGSRGIGLAIALRAARDGANIALLAKTTDPHPTLEGTIHTAAAAIENAGGRAFAVVGDVRDDDRVQVAVERTIDAFGGIDIVVNNASAIDLSSTPTVSMSKYDLMQNINVRGSFLMVRSALPYLERSSAPHILTLSPPLNLAPHWMGRHPAYTLSKYGMSLLTLSFAAEFADAGIGVNSLWPRTTIATAAVKNILGGDTLVKRSRSPEIMADAAHAVLTRDPRTCTGNLYIDDDVLAEEGMTDLTQYAPEAETLELDLFLDDFPDLINSKGLR